MMKLVSRSCLLLCLISRLFSSCDSQLQCYNEYQCEGGTLTSTDDINCYGFSSCYDASMDTSDAAHCHGSYSCAEVSGMMVEGINGVECYGSHSCSDISSMVSTSSLADLNCLGERSCYGTRAFVNDNLLCRGDQSCAEGTFNVSDDATIYGYKAGYNSVFSSAASGAQFYFYGVLAGQRAEVICNEGHECSIYCRGDACNSLRITCDRCSDFSVSCDDDFVELSFACPSGTDVSEWIDDGGDMDLPDLDNLLMNYTSSDGREECSSGEVLNCGDFIDGDCNSMNVDVSTTVCCSAYDACDNGNITTSNGDIRCDGYSSCGISDKLVVEDGDIYFGGFAATSTGTVVQGVNSVTNVYCSGYSSCEDVAFVNGKNIYCLSQNGCYDGVISNFENVYAYADYGLYSGIISSSKNIYCNGYRCCADSTVIGVTNNVIAKGYQSLYSSHIENVNGSVIGIGYGSLQESFIDNVESVYCYDSYCLYDSQIRGVPFIHAEGSQDTLDESLIFSDGIDEMIVEVYGTNTGTYYLYCSNSSTCYVDCQSTYACSGLVLYCKNDNCKVYCSEDNDISCPLYGDYSYYKGSGSTGESALTTTSTSSSSSSDSDDTVWIVLIVFFSIVIIVIAVLVYLYKTKQQEKQQQQQATSPQQVSGVSGATTPNYRE